MNSRPLIYIVGNYKPGDSDGLAEFNAQNVSLLKDIFSFHFVQFDRLQEENYYKHEIIDGFEIHVFGTRNLPVYRLSRTFLIWIKALERGNLAFHLSHIYNINNFLVARQLVHARLPYLITPHDSFVYAPAYTAERSFIKRLYRRIFVNLIDKYILDHASAIHGLTPQCSTSLSYVTKNPVTIVNNQVNDMGLGFNLSAIKQQVCFIGRFNIYTKGIDLSLRAYKLFLASRNTVGDVKFILVGPADLKAESICKSLCEELELENGKEVVFAGKVSKDLRNNILTESKVYLHLARTEGFGLSIAQALSCFKPVIISSQVPISDKIIFHNAGYVVESSESAAKALIDIFSLSENEYNKLALNARRCYETEFHPGIIKPQLTELYLKAIES